MNKKVIIYTYAFGSNPFENSLYRDFMKRHLDSHKFCHNKIYYISSYVLDDDFDKYVVDVREAYIPYDTEEIEIYKKAFELVCDKLGFELDLSDLEKIQNMEWYLQKAKKEVESDG